MRPEFTDNTRGRYVTLLARGFLVEEFNDVAEKTINLLEQKS